MKGHDRNVGIVMNRPVTTVCHDILVLISNVYSNEEVSPLSRLNTMRSRHDIREERSGIIVFHANKKPSRAWRVTDDQVND